LTASPYHRRASIVISRRLARCGALAGEPRVVASVASVVVVVLAPGVSPAGRSSHGWLTLRAARG
jgi:hypothetical protein